MIRDTRLFTRLDELLAKRMASSRCQHWYTDHKSKTLTMYFIWNFKEQRSSELARKKKPDCPKKDSWPPVLVAWMNPIHLSNTNERRKWSFLLAWQRRGSLCLRRWGRMLLVARIILNISGCGRYVLGGAWGASLSGGSFEAVPWLTMGENCIPSQHQ